MDYHSSRGIAFGVNVIFGFSILMMDSYSIDGKSFFLFSISSLHFVAACVQLHE